MKRNKVPELMDDPTLDYASHAEALRGLARLNQASNSAGSLWHEIEKLYQTDRSVNLRLLDIATGGGDVAIALERQARQANCTLSVTGADISADALKYARANAQSQGSTVDFVLMDALADDFTSDYDVIITSLFTHHLDPPQVTALLKNMGQAKRLVLVNDLLRSRMSYALVWLATRMLSRSPVVHYDGPVSVNASYTPAEFIKMGHAAGLHNCQVKLCPPCRQLFIWQPE